MTGSAPQIWIDGAFAAPEKAIAADDRGFLLGDGAFETVLLMDGTPAFLRQHLDRLRRGLEVLAIPPPPFAPLKAAMAELARRNGVGAGRAVARITISRGRGGRGLVPPPDDAVAPTLLLTVGPAPLPQMTPLRLMISERKKSACSSLGGFKAVSGYGENLLARQAAAAAGCDEAILLNEAGRVAGAAAANVFVLAGETSLVTPAVEDGALPGVVRGVVLDVAREAGLAAGEAAIDPDALTRGGVFLTNSLIGVAPAIIDGGEDGGRRAGAVRAAIEALAKAYENILKKEIAEARSRP